MYVKLNCFVTIATQDGKTIKFDAVNNIEIEKSIDKISSLAKIKIPTSARLKYEDPDKTESIQTEKMFKKGDKINIQLGYDDRLQEEYDGFIYKINYTTPLEIECEGHEFLLRDELPTKTFPSTTLKEVLQYIIKDKKITLDGDIPAVNMVNYVIPAKLTRLDALQQVKERYGLTIFFVNNTLYAGLDFVKYKGTVVYSLGVNTPKVDELKFQYADDVKLKVKAIQINKNNTKLEAEIGDKNGEQRTLYFYTAKSTEDLKKLAENEMQKYKYTGYTGKITAFLEPYVTCGMVAEIRDIKYKERSGKYEIRSVFTTFGTSGARRQVEIGKTVS
jgi:hypothetical protein